MNFLSVNEFLSMNFFSLFFYPDFIRMIDYVLINENKIEDTTEYKKNDELFIHIQSIISAKKKLLSEKKRKINQLSKTNEFLEEVREDYNKYNNIIYQQKIEQMKALSMLNDYVKQLTVMGKLSQCNLKDAKHEQRKILNEIKSIKQNLNNIGNNLE
jgi:hypothetical protein